MRYKPIDDPSEMEYKEAAADIAKRFPDIDKDLGIDIARLLNEDAMEALIVSKPKKKPPYQPPFKDLIRDL